MLARLTPAWRLRALRLSASLLAVVLGASLVQIQAPAPAAASAAPPALPPQAEPAKGSPLRAQKPKPDPTADKVMIRPDPVTWPVGGTADVGTTTATVGGLPVTVTRSRANRSATAPGKARIQVYDRTASTRAGLDGPVLRVGTAAPLAAMGLKVGYSAFAHAVGGDWGARLRLVRLPECALTTPDRAECRRGTPVSSINDPTTQTVTADLTTTAGTTLLALTAGDSSVQGDYRATKLSPSSSWQTVLSTGGFGWSYPIRMPPTANGFSPTVGISYSSQAMDGRTVATNNQGSWVGEGFSYEPGFIERRYKPCSDDGHDTSGDQCWARQNGTIVLSGRSGELVRVNDDTWKLSNDDGSTVERLTGATNGDNDGEYWKLTTTDGTQYFFGLNRLPGWADDKQETKSAWSLPVYGDDSGEPCHKPSGFTDSYCDQAWRWNLDYVIDPRGNVVSYFYAREINHYARGGRTDVDGTEYDRGGYLTRIDYGQRDQQAYTTNTPARVVFSTKERCIPGGSVDCDPQDLNQDTAASWPDVPQDRICAAGTHCKDTQRFPTFFTRKRLTRIQTQIRQGAGWTPVESWNLEHAFKANDDNSRTLWPTKLTRTGHWGGTDITAPATEFDGIQLANRIVRDNDNLGPLIRYRLATIKTDTGAQITINYKAPDCTKANVPDPGESTRRCFPVIWNPLGGDDEDKVTDWFHKYVVESVVTDDLVGGNDDMAVSYQYVGDATWRKAEPNGITKVEDLTWSDWRGYQQVIVRSGDGQSMPVRTDHYFMQGMSGGKLPDGTTPTVSVTDSTGKSFTDHDELSGHEYESTRYNGTAIVSKEINEPWRLVTRTQSESWGDLTAAMVGTGVARKLTALPDDPEGNQRWLETRLDSKRDGRGRIVEIDDLGEVGTGKGGDDRCTRTYYVDNTDKHMYSYVSRVQTVSASCADTTPDLATQLISDTRTSYDSQGWNVAPTKGTPTRTEDLDHYDGTNIVYLTTSKTTALDGYSRPTTAEDAQGNVTATQYTDTNGITTQIKTTNPLLHVSTVTLDPAYSVPTRTLDANDKYTDLTYDAFGRRTAVWLADRDRSQGANPSLKFRYQVRNDKTTVVTTERLNNDGSYRASHELYDGLLRLRQTQTPGTAGGWLLTDTFYNGTGQAYKNNDAYLAAGTPGDVPIVTAEGAVNGQTTTVYDGADRPIKGIFSVAGDVRWETTTSYQGDRTSIDPPDGGVPTTVVVNGRGRTSELHQYHGSSPTGPADVTRYTYTSAGSLETVTDPAGNVWRYHYNQRNLRESVEDPDTGDSTYEYDALGRMTATTDSRGDRLSYVYDALGRKTEVWSGVAGTGTKLAAWFYDNTGNKGQLYYSQRIAGNQNYFTIVMSRDQLYRPTKTRYSFPSGGVGAQLGKTYDFTTAYNTDGTVQSVGMPAVGTTMAAEAIATTYDSLRRPTTLGGATSYVTATSYSNTNQLLQAELYTGGTGKKAWLTYGYERGTERLATTKVNRQNVPVVDMDATYQYDAAGNVQSIADAPEGGARDTQCFTYDHLQRLTEAWSTNTTTAACEDGVAQTGVSGPAPYHHSWTFDAAGNRDIETIHSTTGGADTTRDYTFPQQGTGQNQPHTVTQVAENGPAGTRTYRYAYDTAGNTRCRPNTAAANVCQAGNESGHQALTWDAEGHLASSTPAGGQATTYIYDADGNRIARKDPGGTTLFLPGMEVGQVGTALTAIRYYTFAGRTVAVRTSNGVFFQAADHHNTATSTINATTGAIAWRRTTPYGSSRDTVAPAFWPDTRGFLGGTQDNTGLTHLGAREYDPALGMFISADPLIDPNDPSELGGYTYARNNPVTFSDPSGLQAFPGFEGGGGSSGSSGSSGFLMTPLTQQSGTSAIYVDQNGIPHRQRPKGGITPKDQAALDFLNAQLRASGEYYDPKTKTGSRYILQDEDNIESRKLKGVVPLPAGEVTVAGTTSDAIKVSWIDGKIVSVDSYDFTEGKPGEEVRHAGTAVSKMSTDKGAKNQTQFVVFVAKDDKQAAAMRDALAGNPNVRVINPKSGLDTGEMYSKTHNLARDAARARTVAPRSPTAAPKTGKGGVGPGVARGGAALGVVGDLHFIYEGSQIFGSDEQRAEIWCEMYGMYCPMPPSLMG
ncbi:RHS repeat-associated core domain-containing protein [Micromonospora sp. NBRC 101691]|uniref:RHS repeat domain-containing protein n=1 Tax=Micromonospora sp. NBRC 101691 TaxID=3032198 RepID=UPI0024A44634|nr:RHS repeat-associated core domain-containing protein [Micromonospora sp. NBRC 101691]GLY23725.1 type IV secretion protein Rhs [Micromonospora sp. NBRC 101691]